MINPRGPLCILFLLLTAIIGISSCEIKNEKRKDRGILEMNNTIPGIYRGTVIEISIHQRLIYLQTANGKILEITFKNDTFPANSRKELPLKKIRKGSNLEVTLKKKHATVEVEKVLILP